MTRHPKGSQAAVWRAWGEEDWLVEVVSPVMRFGALADVWVRPVHRGCFFIVSVKQITPLGSTARLLLEAVTE